MSKTRKERVDLHNHSSRSHDAITTLADYERAHAEGRFDVLSITDHNRIDGALAFAEQATFPFIVGQEITTADGEVIGLFLERHIERDLPAIETAERIRAQGGLVYLAHPFHRLVRRPITATGLRLLLEHNLVDVVEGLNGGPFMRRANDRAQALARLHQLPVGAGSDAHAPAEIGRCVAVVDPGPLSPRSLKARLTAATLIDRRPSSIEILGGKLSTRLRRLGRPPEPPA